MPNSEIRVGRRATDPLLPPIVADHPESKTMTKANAEATAKLRKEATKNAAAKGITEAKHKPGESAPGVKGVFPKVGVDKPNADGVKSGFTSTPDTTMTTTTKTPATTPATAPTKQDVDAAKAAAAIKAKADKADAATKKAAEAAAAKEAKAKEVAENKAKAATEREAKAAALAEKRKAELGPDSKRTYLGSMLALSDRVKAGVYTKGLTGQLRSNDELALALDAVPTDNVIQLALLALHLDSNPYAALNRGQQSMNLRNKLRGAIRADEGMGLIVVPGDEKTPALRCTLAYVKELRDANNFATAEDAAAKKAEAKKKREDEASAKKAAAEKTKAEAKANAEKAKAAPAAQAAA